MPAIIVCDTHCGVHGGSALWHQVNINLFKHIADTCVRRNIPHIIHLGDWFHDRKSLGLQTIHTSIETAEIIRDFETDILLGNHDLFYKYQSKPTSLDIFREFSNISIVDEVKTVMVDGYELTLAPWNTETIPVCETLLGHLEVTGFGIPTKFKYEIGDFEQCGTVYSGHFHFPMELSNIKYLGAPYHMSFGESGDRRGYYIFNHGKLEFIEFGEYPRFLRLVASEDITESTVRDNIVKLTYTKDFGNNGNTRILEMVQSFKPVQLFTDFSQMKPEESQESQEEVLVSMDMKSGKEILFEYMERRTLPEHLKQGMMKRVLENLMGEGV